MPKRRRSPRSDRLREARRIQRTPLLNAAGILALLAAGLAVYLTRVAYALVVVTFGAYAGRSDMTGELSPFLLTWIVSATIALGGIGILALQRWGWWVAASGAVLGLLDLGRFFGGLFGLINTNHPQAAETFQTLRIYVGIPGALYIAVIAVLMQRQLREAFGVTQPPRVRRGAETEDDFDEDE